MLKVLLKGLMSLSIEFFFTVLCEELDLQSSVLFLDFKEKIQPELRRRELGSTPRWWDSCAHWFLLASDSGHFMERLFMHPLLASLG